MWSSPLPCHRAPGAKAGGEVRRPRAGPGWVQEGGQHPSCDRFVHADPEVGASPEDFLAPLPGHCRNVLWLQS